MGLTMSHAERARRRAEIAAAAAAGEDCVAIAARFGVTWATVRGCVREAGRETHASRLKRRNGEIAQAARGGATIKEIAERFDVSATLIRNACRAAGVKVGRAPSGHIWGAIYHTLAELLRGERTVAQIAQLVQVSQQYVGQVRMGCRAAGITLPALVGGPQASADGEDGTKTLWGTF